MNILQLIASNSFITTNKAIIKLFGLIEANIIGLFASMANFNDKNNNDGWFYITYERIEDELNISKHISSKAIEKLIKSGVLIDKKQGVPCRRFFKFQEQELFNSLKLNNLTIGNKDVLPPVVKNFNYKELNSLTTSSKDTSHLVVKELNGYNNKENNKENNLFSFEEIKKYFSENGFKSDFEDFWNYWEKKDWRDGKSKITNRESAAKAWERRYKKMNPAEYIIKEPVKEKSKDELELEEELNLLRSEIKSICHRRLNDVYVAQYLDLFSLEKTTKGYEVVALDKERAKKYKEILVTLNIKIK